MTLFTTSVGCFTINAECFTISEMWDAPEPRGIKANQGTTRQIRVFQGFQRPALVNLMAGEREKWAPPHRLTALRGSKGSLRFKPMF